VSWGIGLILGPALGGILGQIDLRAPAFSAAAFSLANLAIGFFLLPESLFLILRFAIEPWQIGLVKIELMTNST